MRDAAIANRVKIKSGEALGFQTTLNDCFHKQRSSGQALDKQRAILDYIMGSC